jgi:N-acetylneuraminic acid mutarotase
MFRFLAPCGFALVPLLAVAAESAAAPAWTARPAYPLAPGMAGISAGAHGGVLIAAGGANFPERMPWDGGRKVYYDEIFVLAPGASSWRPAGKLPERRAYAACVSLPGGVLLIGGENSETVFGDTLWLRWDGRAVVTERGAALPAPRTSQVAAVLDGRVYVAGGYAPGTVRTSCGDFWCYDPAAKGPWGVLPTWPGPTRAQGTIAALDGALYLISGLEITVDAAGKPQPKYLSDAYRFRARKWERLPDPPWTTIGAPTPAPVTPGNGRIWVLGGVDSRLVGKVPRDTRVPGHVMYFDAVGGTWQAAAERWPDPVVTSPAVPHAGEWWIVSGEIMAGVRTTGVSSWRPEAAR